MGEPNGTEKRPTISVPWLDKEDAAYRALVIGAGPLKNEFRRLPKTQLLGWTSGPHVFLSVAYYVRKFQ